MIIINKRNLFFLISVWLLSTLLSAQNVTISTPHTQLLLSGTKRRYTGTTVLRLTHLRADIRSICETARRRNAYPVYGMGYPCETALSVRHADGNLTLQMAVIGVKETRLTKENATLTVIELKDKCTFLVNIATKHGRMQMSSRHGLKSVTKRRSLSNFSSLLLPTCLSAAAMSGCHIFPVPGQTKDNSARKRCNRV